MANLNLSQTVQLLAFFGGDDAKLSVEFHENGHDGPGVYAWITDYPEEGSIRLDPDFKITNQCEAWKTAATCLGKDLVGK